VGDARIVQTPIALMIEAPSAAAREGGRTFDSARPEVIAPAVAAIVTAAMTALGAAAIRVSRIPNATPAARLSRLDTAAITTAESQSIVQRYVRR
jgi:hypothetical protein